MTIDIPVLTVAAACVAQIYVVSFHLPSRIRDAYQELFTRLPPTQHPHLYPLLTPAAIQRLTGRRWASCAIGCAGLALFASILYYSGNAWQLARAMLLFQLAQMLPWLLTITRLVKVIRTARRTPPPQVRSADLQRLLLEDCLPRPAAFAAIAIATMAAGLCVYFMFMNSMDRAAITYLLLVNLVLLWRMLHRALRPLEFSRFMPFLNPGAQTRNRRQMVRLLFMGGAGFGTLTLFVTLSHAGAFDLRYEYVAIVLSLVLQIYVLWLGRMLQRLLRKAGDDGYPNQPLPGPGLS
jgi:hypothetical protein